MTMWSTIRGGAVCALVAAALSCAGVSSASALSPWWHLTVHTSPTAMQPGKAHDEVQSIEATLEEKGLGTPVVGFGVRIKGELVGYFATEPLAARFKLPVATAANLQAALEGANGYGAGNVEVTGGPAGTSPLLIKSIGSDTDAPVPQIETENFGIGKASATVTTQAAVDGKIAITAANLGDASANGTASPIVITGSLPPHVRAATIEGREGRQNGQPIASGCSLSGLSCTFAQAVGPYSEDEVLIGVVLEEGAQTGALAHASVIGGEAPPATTSAPVAIGAPVSFGPRVYEASAEEEGGALDQQAGSHPFQLTATLALDEGSEGQPAALAKDLVFKLPPGVIGNPTPFTRCTVKQLFTEVLENGSFNLGCPIGSVVGVARVRLKNGPGAETTWAVVPLYNLEPQEGEPARFGFLVAGVGVFLDTSVRTGGDYGVTVTVDNISEAQAFLASEVTFWGVPGSATHNASRGYTCLSPSLKDESEPPACSGYVQSSPPPLLSLPTSCTGNLATTVEADPWNAEGRFVSAATAIPALVGCNRLPFSSTLSVAPDTESAASPSGLTVGIHVPQEEALNAEGLAPSDVRDTTVTLPEGVALNPAAADGLMACSTAQIALDADVAPSCPEASKVATVTISTPLLPNKLQGNMYLAAQDENPFGSLVALYLTASDPVSGTLVKLAGEVKLDPVTGRLITTFLNTPQFPFEDLELHFFGGARAPLGTPALCGTYTTVAAIEPWSGNPPSASSSSFRISSGPNGSPCSDPVPFKPSLTAGATNIQAGAFSPFTMTMSREDGEQNLSAVQLHMPPGFSGVLSGVELCSEARANAGACGPNSQIGETTVSVGLGGDPDSVTGGKVYITGPYEGAPFGISVVVPAKAGPYDLGQVVVRGRIEVDPTTAALTVTTNSEAQGHAIPHILDGIPLQIKHVNVLINRPGFTFNPTNCNPLSLTGSLASVEGSSAGLSVPFQVTDCATLGFKPHFSIGTSAHTSRANGASLDVRLSYPRAPFGSQSNVGKVRVELPKQLPSRLTTLQKACPDNTFNANPEACPTASRVGEAVATTPIIPEEFSGPAYFVSHGGARFPELIIALHGYSLTVYLHGETFISKAGVTSTTFNTVPDVPIGSFELRLPQGPDSALAANGDLCAEKLVMPTTFTAQSGAVIEEKTPIAVEGCVPEIRVIGHKVSGKTATIVVSVPSAGRLSAGGGGISRISRRIVSAGIVTVTLRLSKAEQRFVARHHGRRLMAPIRLSFTPAHGKRLSARVAVLMK